MRDAIVPIVEHVHGMPTGAIPDRVTRLTKMFVLDTVALMFAGAKTPGCNEVLQQILDWSGKSESTLIPYARKAPAPYAAMMNSMAAHAFDFDDTHERSGVHAYSVVLPAVIAVAERGGHRVSGADLLAAITIGVDISYRMGMAIKYPHGWHLTAVFGVFSAALAAGRIMGLSRDELHNAAGIAYSLSAGNLQCILDGSLTKRMQPALASRSAVEAAIWASRGITGSKNVLEGQFGYYTLYERGKYDQRSLIEGLGERFENEASSLKPYPSCRCNHASIDAILEMVATNSLTPDQVKSITVTMPRENYDSVGGKYRPGDSPQVSAQFNIAYNIAAALVRRKVGFAEFTSESVLDPQLQALADRIESVPNDDPYLFGPQEIVVRLNDGKTLSRTVTVVKGHPGNPMSEQELNLKVQDCLRVGQIDGGMERDLRQWIDGLETFDDPIKELSSLVAGAKAPVHASS